MQASLTQAWPDYCMYVDLLVYCFDFMILDRVCLE